MPTPSMPPPSPPPAHRRTRSNIQPTLPPSPPCSPNSSTCGLRKMSLPKGATFHVPSSPPTDNDPVLSIRHLTRRSPTCSSSTLMSLMFDKEDTAKLIEDFEQTFSGARGKQLSGRRRGLDDLTSHCKPSRTTSLPSDEGIGPSISGSSDG